MVVGNWWTLCEISQELAKTSCGRTENYSE